MPEERFGPYRLVELLGRGGMGEVWRAVDTGQDDRVVAVKLLSPALRGDADLGRRFRREQALTARLQHPHVVSVNRYGDVGGRLFIEMPLLAGVDLAALLQSTGPLPADRAVRIVTQAARGLNAAHRAGLVHRDVKPSNILVCSDDGDDHVFLIDFGVVRSVAETAATAPGTVVGTPPYMAPEAFEGGADTRSDVYSLGCVLYEALTGVPAFRAADYWGYLRAHLEETPPRASATRAGLPPALDDVVARALRRRPDERFASPLDLAAAARQALPAASAPGAPPPDASEEVLARLLKERIVVIGQQLDDTLAARVVAQLRQLDAADPAADIQLYLNSPGGGVMAATAVLTAMDWAAADVRTCGLGLAGGVASLLLAAGAPGKRYLAPRAQVQLSQPRSDRRPGGGSGRLLDWHRSATADLYGRCTGKPVDQVAADMARGLWLTAPEAVAYGLADHVIRRAS